MRADRLNERRGDPYRLADPVRHHRAIEIDPFASIDTGLAVQRRVIAILADENVREQPGAWPATLDRQRGHRSLHHALADPARKRGPDVPDDLEAAGDVVQHLADVLTDLAHRAAAGRAGAIWGMDDLSARQMFGQRAPAGRLPAHGRGKILDLRPDLVLSFSDLQADIVAALIRQGAAVHAFNQRAIAEIFDMIRLLGALVGAADRADRLADELEAAIADARRRAMQRSRRPLVYFEEWDEPMISGIAWVSELIEVAGGIDIFADRSAGKSAKDRMVTAEEIIAREPDVIIGSWCGKKFRPEKVTMRPGFERIPAVRNGALYEIKSPIILQPGPAALTDGLKAFQTAIRQSAKIAAMSTRGV